MQSQPKKWDGFPKSVIRTVQKPESAVILPAVLLVAQNVPKQQIADVKLGDECGGESESSVKISLL